MNISAESFATVAFTIFFVLNATGQIPLFLALLTRFDHKRQLKIITRELIIALVILLMFTFFGDWILKVLGISRATIAIAGGILLFLISLTMIFPKPQEQAEHLTQEPMVIPLAIPVITGPGAITTVMTYAHNTGRPMMVAGAVICAWIPSLIILLLGSYIKKILGERGLIAVERVGGMLVCLIGLNMSTTGILLLVKEYFRITVG
ncbi:MAG TPA: MarC family protein [Chlamydiales bacterium]|jgi:multiple antibiotic resistance protein|nr:MarC family protein [Chlamydiales bacterium]